jgi:hypothetical protein
MIKLKTEMNNIEDDSPPLTCPSIKHLRVEYLYFNEIILK